MNYEPIYKEKNPNYKDYISYEPKEARFLPKEGLMILEEHSIIVKALRNKHMTVKELHNLYYDIEKQKHTFTIKTIYRHLEKLEEAGLVTTAGHRITKGARMFEKLYCRTAKVYFSAESDEEGVKIWDLEDGATYSVMDMLQLEKFSQKLEILMSELFDNPELDHESFDHFIQTLYKIRIKSIIDIYEKTKKSEVLSELLANSTLSEIDSLTNLVGILSAFLQNPELITRLKTLFNVENRE